MKIFKSYSFDIPIISIGNITVGGTGKTPHIEYFIREYLSKGQKVAVLSRGYKRKSKGFIIAQDDSNAEQIGDEPYQIYHKFPQITVVVDKDRVRAVNNLLCFDNRPDVILLDDAFQYRRLNKSKDIVLVNYRRPVFDDRIMPYGLLRENVRALKRADEVIVSKCPEDISDTNKRVFTRKLNLPEGIPLKFSTMEFMPPMNIYDNSLLDISQKYDCYVFTGVVNADTLYSYVENFSKSMTKTVFPDHHDFTCKDIEQINKLVEEDTIVVITEKDAAKLISNKFISEYIKKKIYSVEIRVKFL